MEDKKTSSPARTRNPGSQPDLLELPQVLAVPSRPGWETAIEARGAAAADPIRNPSTGKETQLHAFILPVDRSIKLKITRDGRYTCNGNDIDLVSLSLLQREALAGIDLMPMKVLYSGIHQMILRGIQSGRFTDVFDVTALTMTIKKADLLDRLGLPTNTGGVNWDAFWQKLEDFQNMIGVITLADEKGRWFQERYPLIAWLGTRADGTMQFATPYLSALAFRVIEEAAPRKTLKAQPDQKKLRLNPHHTYLVSAAVAKVKDPKAVEIALLICTLIEQRGSYNYRDPDGGQADAQAGNENTGAPNIGAQTLIDKVEAMQLALANASSTRSKNRILAKTFSRVEDILKNYTLLSFYYPDIQLDIEIPTTTTVKKTVYTFPHSRKVLRTTKQRDAASDEIIARAKLRAMQARETDADDEED